MSANPFEESRSAMPPTKKAEPSKSFAPVPIRKDIPHNAEAERGLLCCAMNSRIIYWDVRETISADTFYLSDHKTIWLAIDFLHERGKAVDPITLQKTISEISDQKINIDALTAIYNFLPSTNNWKDYRKFCEEQQAKRSLHAIAVKMRLDIESGKDPIIIKQEVESRLNDSIKIKDTIATISEAVDRRLEDWENAIETSGASSIGLSSGIKGWDEVTYGCRPGTLHVIVGDSKAGKTTLALQMATTPAIQYKKPVMIFSLEMSEESLVDKMVCGNGNVSMRSLMNGDISPKDYQRLAKSVAQVRESPIFLWSGGSLTPSKFESIANRAKLEHNIEMIVVDYYQLMEGDDRTKNREQQLSDIGRAMRKVANDLRIPIVLIAQLNDDGKLRESRSLKMHADTLTKISISKDKKRHLLNVDYNRDGATASIPCYFHKDHARFEQCPEEESE
jgi:replicative DNA helicase